MANKKRRISQFAIAQKALQTSSASRRFKAEDEYSEESIKRDIGASGDPESEEERINRLRQEGLEDLTSKEAQAQIRLLGLSGVSEEYWPRIIRRSRQEMREKLFERGELEEGAPERARERPGLPQDIDTQGALSAYGQEDRYAKRVRNKLGSLINKGPGNRYLARGGSTYMGGRIPWTRGDPTKTIEPLDVQLIGPAERGTRKVPKERFDIIADSIASSIAGGETDFNKVMNLFSEETENELRPRIESRLRERGVDVEGETISRVEQVLEPEQVIWKAQDRTKAANLVQERAALNSLDRRLKEHEDKALREKRVFIDKDGNRKIAEGKTPVGLRRGPGQMSLFDRSEAPDIVTLRRRVQTRQNEVERELSKLRPDAIVEGQTQTPEETERMVRKGIQEALTIPDPLGRVRPGLAGVARNKEDLTQFNEPLQKIPASKEQLDALVEHTVKSYHAPTHAQRVDAERKAERLAAQISKQTQRIIGDREERAAHRRIIDDLRREGVIPPEPALPSSYKEEGERLDILEKSRESREGQIYTPGKGWAKAPPPRPPVGPPPGTGAPTPGGYGFPPPKAYEDPRLNPQTVEDYYDAYGHERVAPRLAWEKNRLKARFEGKEVLSEREIDELKDKLAPKADISEEEKEKIRTRLSEAFTERPPAPFSAIKQQGKFLKNQSVARWRGFKEGSEILGFTEKGAPIAFPGRTSRTMIGTAPRARAGVSPNIVYEYKLRNPKSNTEDAQKVQDALDDLYRERRDHIKREAGSQGFTSEQNFVISSPRLRSLNERIIKQEKRLKEFKEPITRTVYPTDIRTQFHVGKRDRFGKLMYNEYDEVVAPVTTKPQQEEQLRVRFGGRQLKNRPKEQLPENVEEIRYIPSPGAKGQTHTVDHPEGGQKIIYLVAPREAGRRGEEVEVSREEYEAHQADIQTALSQNRTPPVFVRTEPIPRKIQYKFVDPSHLELKPSQRDIASFRVPKIGPFGERVGHLQFSEDEESLWNKFPGKVLQSYGETQRLKAAKQIAETSGGVPSEVLERHGFKDKSEAKQIMEAATTAGIYGQITKFREGTLPLFGNRILGKVKEKHPGVEEHLGDVRFSVNKAYTKPALQTLADIPFMITHPLSSRTGEAMGLDFSSIKYRQELINSQKMAKRALEREAKQVEAIQRTKTFVQENQGKKGPVGAFTRWRLGALERTSDYKPYTGTPTGTLGEALKHAHEATDEGTFTYWRNKTLSPRTIRDLPEATRKEAQELLKKYEAAEAADQLRSQYGFIRGVSKATHPSFFNRAIEHSGTERNLLIGGAVVGTAAGAGYLYYRHQQKKKPEEQRVSLYNKLLPPPFETPKVIPRLDVTHRVQFGDKGIYKELGLSGKALPLQVGVSFHKKRFAPRPSDRGYEANLPLIGKPSLRGTPGGSKAKGLIYHGRYDTSGTNPLKRTALRRSTHEIRVLGKKIPGAVNIGVFRDVQLQRANPRRLRVPEMESIIWAHSGAPSEDQEHVKNFYRGMGGQQAQRLLEMWDTPEEVDRIRREKGRGTPEYRRYQAAAVRERRRVGQARGVR